jgi:hypothetical protein
MSDAGKKRLGGSRSSKPLVVARRWDQLAGRLNTMTNALALAELVGLDFRFVWVRGFDRHVNDPRELFDDAFLDKYEIDESELDGRPAANFRDLQATKESVTGALAQAGDGAFIEMEELFGIVVADDETAAAARERFKRCFAGMGWNSQVQRLMARSEEWPELQDAAAVHIRAGDIVSGAWRQSLVHSKYTPTPFVHNAIEQLGADGERQVLVLSDHAEYLAWLKDRFNVITSADVIPGYERMTEIQQAIADILLMSRCRPVLGPPTSGFSIIAARLGAGEFERADALAEPGGERSVLLTGIAERRSEEDLPDFWGPLTARDACWALDVFGDSLSLRHQQELALAAVQSEPGFCSAHTHLARVAMLRGHMPLARRAAEEGERLATVEHGADPTAEADPLTEALAVQIAVRCFAAIHAEAGLRRIVQRRLRHEILDLQSIYDELDRCLELRPYWTDVEAVWDSLRFLIATTDQVIRAKPQVRRRVAQRLTGRRFERSAMTAIQPSGLERHRAVEVFDALTPELDRICLHLYEAARDSGLVIGEPRLVRVKTESPAQAGG